MSIHRSFSALFLITMTVCLLTVATDLAAGPLKVKSANPNSGVQGETHTVTIKGVGFTDAKKVRFLVTKSSDTGNVAVTLLSIDDDETLTTEVVIPDGATIADYDIEVQLQSGRKGKGTTLFKVLAKGGGGGTGSTLTANFCLNIFGDNPGLASDGKVASNGSGNDYCNDRKEGVHIGTGSSPGFGFNTNTISHSRNIDDRRRVQVNFPDGSVTALADDGTEFGTFGNGEYHFRLWFNMGNGGLDLGSMLLDSEGAPDYFIPLNIFVKSPDENDFFALAYSTNTDPLDRNALIGAACVAAHGLDAQVKRLAEDEWSIESNPADHGACLWDMNAANEARTDFGNQMDGTQVDDLRFYFQISILP